MPNNSILIPTSNLNCKYVLFVRISSSTERQYYEATRACFNFIRTTNKNQGPDSPNRLLNILLFPLYPEKQPEFTQKFTKEVALAFSEFFTSSSVTRQRLCSVRNT